MEQHLQFEILISDTAVELLMSSPDNLKQVVEVFLGRIREFFQVDRCSMLPVADLASRFPRLSQRVLEDQEPIQVSGEKALPPNAPVDRESWLQQNLGCLLVIPILRGGSIEYVLTLGASSKDGLWEDHYIDRLQRFGGLLAQGLGRHSNLEVRWKQTANETRLALAIDLVGAGFYEVDFVTGVTYTDRAMVHICGFPGSEDDGLLNLEFWKDHLHPEDRERVMEARTQLHSHPPDRTRIEYRYLHPERGTIWIQHIGGVSERAKDGHAQRTFGVLRDVTREKSAELEMRDLSRRLISASEEERALLARELHDDMTQRLAMLAIGVGRAEAQSLDSQQVETLRSVREELVKLSEDIHQLAYHLHPAVLTELGLVQALRAECGRLKRSRNLDCRASFSPAVGPVDPELALCLFRVAQEALNNVARHSRASEVTLSLQPLRNGLLLTVQDSGVGFDPESALKRRTLGLVGMRERIKLVSGTLEVVSAPGEGTLVQAWVPVARP